jgi:hypothetical protein
MKMQLPISIDEYLVIVACAAVLDKNEQFY